MVLLLSFTVFFPHVYKHVWRVCTLFFDEEVLGFPELFLVQCCDTKRIKLASQIVSGWCLSTAGECIGEFQ